MPNAYPRSMQARLRRLDRDHPGWMDAAVAVAAGLPAFASVLYVVTLVGWGWALALSGLPVLALVRRRRSPRLVLVVCLTASLLQWVLAVPFNFAQLAALVALYTVCRYGSRRAARIGVAAGLLVIAIAPLRQPFAGLGSTALALGVALVIYLLGTNVRLRQEYLHALEERAERLERERDAVALAAAVVERTRIARELHDVVAHHVSVMVVQAEGAGWSIESAPDQARTAVATIAETGRSTLVELRRLLGVLRDGDDDGVLPQPVLADLPALVEGFRAAGLDVLYRDQRSLAAPADVPADLPESLQLAAFRIVQEGLTNALKHAGAGAEVAVRLGSGPGGLVVEVRDTGRGSAGAGLVVGAVSGAATGHGLVGIRERVALFDGEVQIGPMPDGGFLVRGVLPVPAFASATVRGSVAR